MIKDQGYKYIMLILVLIFSNSFHGEKIGFLLGILCGIVFVIIDCIIYKKRKENLFSIIIDIFVIILFLYGYYFH